MLNAKFFVGSTVVTPLGVGKVTMLRFSSRKGGRFYVIGDGFESYFKYDEIELTEPIHDPAKTSPCPKVHFHSYKLAQDKLKIIMRTSQRKKIPVRAYKCDKCGLWHLTSRSL